MRATAASTRSPFSPSGTSSTFRSTTSNRAPIMITVVAAISPPRPDMALAVDGNSFHHRQVHDHDGGCCDAHVCDVEDWPVWQLQEVDHVTAEHSWGTKQPVGEISCDASTQQPDSHRPGRVADTRYQLDDHEAQHRYTGDGEHVGEALTLAESRTRVADKSQGEQSTQQPNRDKRLQLSHCDDLGDEISCQPSNSDHGDDDAPASSLDGASAADWGYRRSSRCLHVTHNVARGNACNRPLPIGCPQLSQLPYVPSSMCRSARRD